MPVFRWAGSKRKILPILAKFWSERFDRYLEPFAGSACLFLKLEPKSAILSDLNSNLIRAYRAIRSNPRRVAELLYAVPRNARTYYAVRAGNEPTYRTLPQAVRFIYLNRNCFNGLYRTNRDGMFNVPYGAEQGSYPRICDFEKMARLLKRAKLMCLDFGAALRHVRRNDFVYLDPPFAATGVRTFTEYGKTPFDPNDLGRLARHLERIDKRGAFFVVSYAHCDRARSIARSWNSATISVRRDIAGFGSKRKIASELLITNLPLPESLCQN